MAEWTLTDPSRESVRATVWDQQCGWLSQCGLCTCSTPLAVVIKSTLSLAVLELAVVIYMDDCDLFCITLEDSSDPHLVIMDLQCNIDLWQGMQPAVPSQQKMFMILDGLLLVCWNVTASQPGVPPCLVVDVWPGQ